MVNNTNGTEKDGVLKYFMATAIKWVNHTFICISVDEGGTKIEWSNKIDLVRLRTYFKGIWENIFYSSEFVIPFIEMSFQIVDYLDIKMLLKDDQTTSLW